MNFIVLISLVSALYIIGDIVAKFWALKGYGWLYILALVAYFVGSLLFIHTIKASSLSLAVMVSTLSILLLSLIFGYFVFGERLHTLQYIGTVFGIVALVLLLWPQGV